MPEEIYVSEVVRLDLDGRWKLEELLDLTKNYIQLYGFTYSLLDGLPTAKRSEMEYLYSRYPWRGGFSTINFFTSLFGKIPPELRPEIIEIKYASPGHIALQELLIVAASIIGIVRGLTYSLNAAHELYRKIQRGSTDLRLSQVNLAREELELTRQQIQFCREMSSELVSVLGLTPEQNAILEARVGGNQVAKMKLLLSVFRRAEPLAMEQKRERLFLRG